MGALVDGPLDRFNDIRAASAVVAQHLSNQCFLYSRCNPDSRSADFPSQYGAGTVCPVPVFVSISLPRKVLLDDFDAGKGRVSLINAGIKNGDNDPLAGER